MSVSDAVIGIDFGTSYSCVAIWQNERAEVVTNEQGNRLTPCCVAFTDVEQLVGEPAFNQLVKNPRNTVCQARRLLGRYFSEDGFQSSLSGLDFVIKDVEGRPVITVVQAGEDKDISVEEVCAVVLKLMKETAEAFLGKKVAKAVLTVPVHFSSAQRQALIDVGEQAGLEVLRLINEPTAVALAYGHDVPVPEPKNILVFDFGGSSLDVSVIRVDGGLFEVLASDTDANLGGDDIDTILLEHFVKEFKRKHKCDIKENKRSLRRLRFACEKAKRVLSSSVQTVLEADSLYEGIDFFANISRGRFDELITDILKRCLKVVDTALQEANLEKDSVSEVLMAGGSSRIPRVVSTLANYFGDATIKNTINPDETVASGAAKQAVLLSASRSKLVDAVSTHDLTTLSIGIEAADGTMVTVIPRNTPVPRKEVLSMSTSVDNQNAVFLQIYEGERLLAKDNTLLGHLSLQGIPDAPAGTPKVDVVFTIDENGRLKVDAKESSSKAKAQLTIDGSTHRLSHAEIDQLVRKGQKDRAIQNGDAEESDGAQKPSEEETMDDDMD